MEQSNLTTQLAQTEKALVAGVEAPRPLARYPRRRVSGEEVLPRRKQRSTLGCCWGRSPHITLTQESETARDAETEWEPSLLPRLIPNPNFTPPHQGGTISYYEHWVCFGKRVRLGGAAPDMQPLALVLQHLPVITSMPPAERGGVGVVGARNRMAESLSDDKSRVA